MALLDLLGRRWAMRVLWELRTDRMTFRALRDACGNISPTVLNDRLRELRGAALVDAGDDGYGLSSQGSELVRRFTPLVSWSERWARSLHIA